MTKCTDPSNLHNIYDIDKNKLSVCIVILSYG